MMEEGNSKIADAGNNLKSIPSQHLPQTNNASWQPINGKKEEERKDGGLNQSITELPKSTIKVNRVSLSQLTLRDAEIFTEKTTIGQGTFG